ncbi:STRUBBELIG-RECEPTOR FAMILY 3-like protein, partial [Drosera capensis]
MPCMKWDANGNLMIGFLVLFMMPFSAGFTDSRDGIFLTLKSIVTRRVSVLEKFVMVLTSVLFMDVFSPVFAINRLYAALGSPPLQGWVQAGGDPCAEAWQGVQCVISNITQLILNGANLRGELGTDLDSFTSMIEIDLTDNHISGSIPSNLPSTIKTLYLSGNQFTGSIPSSLSILSQL